MKSSIGRNGKKMALGLYDLKLLPDQELNKRVEYLLEKNRFICDSSRYEVSFTLIFTDLTMLTANSNAHLDFSIVQSLSLFIQ